MTYDIAHAEWFKSSHSFEHGSCVEVSRNLPGVVAIRDSKRPRAAALVLPAESFHALVRAAKH